MSQDIRVLVGDDDVNDRFFLEWGFRQTCPNVKVDFARNGQEVIQYLEENLQTKPSIVILDSMMPKMDGFAVLGWLRTRSEFDEVPVVMLTGKLHETNAAKAGALGVREYIEKPHDFPELLTLIKGWRTRYLTSVNGV